MMGMPLTRIRSMADWWLFGRGGLRGRLILTVSLFLSWGVASGTLAALDLDGCSLRVLVLMVPEVPSYYSYWNVEEAQRFNEVTRWLLDLYGMSYDEIYPSDLSTDLLYDEEGLAYSVVVDNGNRLDAGKEDLLLEAVARDGMGLVTHTASAAYISDEMGILEVPWKGWKDRAAWGEFAVYDEFHYITRLCYAPTEQTTHNLVAQDKPEYSFIHRVELTSTVEDGIVLAMTQESPMYPPMAPEIIAKEVGLGRIVWFARPFYVYTHASYFFVERDHIMTFLLARAIEWSSRDGVMVSRWLYPYGHWCAHAIILDGYYDYPPPGYREPITPPSSLDELIWNYGTVEDFLTNLRQRFTASVIFRNNATTGWDAGYDLTHWDTGIQSLKWLKNHGNELALGAFDYINYEELTRSPESRAMAITNLVKGREAMVSLFNVDDAVYVFSFVPEELITGDGIYELVAEAGFDTIVGGIYKTDFPYDLYGSIYPYYLSPQSEEETHRVVIIENNFFFDSITEDTDLFYIEDVYKRHGALIMRIPPWQIHNQEDKLSMLKNHIDQTRKENVWWTTIGELGRYTHQRYNVEVSAEAYNSGRRIIITARNNDEEEIEGFTVKVKLEDNSAPTQHPTTPMEIISITQEGLELIQGDNWVLEDIAQNPASLLIWMDLSPGEKTRFEVTTTGGRAPIPESTYIIIVLLTLLKWGVASKRNLP